MPIREALAQLLSGNPLSSHDAEALFEDILGGLVDDAQIGATLALIQARSPAVDEIVGGATAMRRHVTPIPGTAGLSGNIIDTCGTGGAPKTFNISTIAAIVTAAAAPGIVRVAKHGNRSRTGRGSAEVLAALGVNVDASPAVQARCLREISLCFCFAVHHHPAMKHASAARRSLGFPTLFNVLGPLTNPAHAKRQLMGVYDRSLVEKVGRTLATLGTERAMVVHSHDGMDEIATSAPTTIAHVTAQSNEREPMIEIEEFDPRSIGVARVPLEALACADLAQAVDIARGVLAGLQSPARDIVALNAGAALVVGGGAGSLADGIQRACRAIDSGAAQRTLEQLATLSHEHVPT